MNEKYEIMTPDYKIRVDILYIDLLTHRLFVYETIRML